MEHLFADSAEGLAHRFRNNDVNNNIWTVSEQGWESLLGWTTSQGREVADAARHNTSIRTLYVWIVNEMPNESIDVLSIIVEQLNSVLCVKILYPENIGTVTLHTVEKLFAAIAKCPSDVKHLDCRVGACLSSRGFLALADSFPNIESLVVNGPRRPPQLRFEASALAENFALTFAVTVPRKLPFLRRVELAAASPHPTLPTFLSGLYAPSSVRTIKLTIPHGANDLIRAARCVCASNSSAEEVFVAGPPDDVEAFTDLTDFFDIGPIPSFSPSVTRMEFSTCKFDQADTGGLVNNAVKALQNVRSLCFGLCVFPSAMKVVERLPRLTKLLLLCRTSEDDSYRYITDAAFFSSQYVLLSDSDVEMLCNTVERHGSLLNDIELDLIGRLDESFPAISRLMTACRGRLVLNFGEFSWRGIAHLIKGARSLRDDLQELRLRFVECNLDGHDFAALIRALTSRKTLSHLEIGFRHSVDIENAELSNAILGLVESNDALQTLSLRDLPANGTIEILEGIMLALTTKNRSLRALEWHGSYYQDEFMPRALALEMLKENDVISTLEGFDIPEGDPVEALLLQNRYGRIFLRPNDPNPIGIWATVLARVSRDQQIGVMYKFLRAKPGLVRRRKPLPSPGGAALVGQKRVRDAMD